MKRGTKLTMIMWDVLKNLHVDLGLQMRDSSKLNDLDITRILGSSRISPALPIQDSLKENLLDSYRREVGFDGGPYV